MNGYRTGGQADRPDVSSSHECAARLTAVLWPFADQATPDRSGSACPRGALQPKWQGQAGRQCDLPFPTLASETGHLKKVVRLQDPAAHFGYPGYDVFLRR